MDEEDAEGMTAETALLIVDATSSPRNFAGQAVRISFEVLKCLAGIPLSQT